MMRKKGTVMEIKLETGRKAIELGKGKFMEVRPFQPTHLLKYIGYYDRSKVASGEDYLVYVYRGKLKKTDIKIPGSIYKHGNSFIWTPHDPDVASLYDIRNAKSIDPKSIVEALNRKDIRIKEIPVEVSDSIDGEIFAPKIRDTDDILKRIIKTVLQNMKLNIKTLRPKFSNDYDLNNLKSQLVKEGAMSSKYFVRWCEILDIQIETIIRNRPGSNRLSDEVTVFLE